jgi:ssDNA-binding Zn-finger/Zn-ribbon topoisomerase 1
MAGLTYENKFYVKCLDKAGKGCSRSWYTTDATYGVRAERERPQVDIPCPKCGSPMEARYSTNAKHYLGCTKSKDPECKAWWPTDEAYAKARNGHCTKCKGPMRPTKDHGDVCVKCGTFAKAKES